jgi:hypothetical protein
VLFQHDVALNRWRQTVFVIFRHPIAAFVFVREDFENYHGVGNHFVGAGALRADDESVRVTNSARDLDLQFAAVGVAAIAPQATRQGDQNISLDDRMRA